MGLFNLVKLINIFICSMKICLVNIKHYLHNQFDSMDIDYTVAALMFPAIPLMMTMYSNRFHTLSALIRQIHDQYTFEKKVPPEWENQLHVLNKRTNLLKYVMGFAAFGFLFNMSTVLMLYLNTLQIARLNFAACCLCMIISIFLFLQEIRLSNQALKFHLSDMDSMKKDL